MSISLRDIKRVIGRGDLEAVKAFYTDIAASADEDNPIDWPTVYKECYLHACLKKQRHIAAWFEEVFKEFDELTQIALRQIFPYGRYLLR
jgi:hypothetical protein